MRISGSVYEYGLTCAAEGVAEATGEWLYPSKLAFASARKAALPKLPSCKPIPLLPKRSAHILQLGAPYGPAISVTAGGESVRACGRVFVRAFSAVLARASSL